jgi:hypothetical protein
LVNVSKTRFGVCDVGRTLAISVRCPDTVRPLVQMLLVRRLSKAFRSTSLVAMPRFRSEVDMSAWRFGCCQLVINSGAWDCCSLTDCFPLQEQVTSRLGCACHEEGTASMARQGPLHLHRPSNLNGSCLTIIPFRPATNSLGTLQ